MGRDKELLRSSGEIEAPTVNSAGRESGAQDAQRSSNQDPGINVTLPRNVQDVFDDLHAQMDEVRPQLSKSILISIGTNHMYLDPTVRPLRFTSARRETRSDARITCPDSAAFLRAVEKVRGASVGFVVR